MPLFKSKSTRRSVSPPPPAPSHNSGGLFSRNKSRSRSPSSGETSPTRHSRGSGSAGGFLGMGRNKDVDPSILQARQRIQDAEIAEKEADRALLAARDRVRDAREHVKLLEQEAVEDARRAKLKQAEAKNHPQGR
ncbi:hypothetical protein BKA70DRAFT_1217954 [Coprinopsis sp. MPI-PUGE-AT-0042]|nr:hypothetical protein BKA70DRAFT_1217954 [Coprinopsis sp. MPI-PUGE-AT-0042]